MRNWYGVLVLALIGCGDDAQPPEQTSIDYELLENARVLDADTLGALTSVSSDFTLSFAHSTPLVDELAPGMVLLAGASAATPYGLLRKVTMVDRSSSPITVATQPATVFHAFRRLNLRLREPLTTAAPPIPPAPTAITVGGTLGGPILWEVFDGDHNPATTEDRLEATGSLTSDVSVHFDMSFDWQNLSVDQIADKLSNLLDNLNPFESHELWQLVGLQMNFSVATKTEGDVRLLGRASLEFENKKELGSVPVATFTVGPILFVTRIILEGTVKGGATSDVDIKFAGGATFSAGFSLGSDDGFVPWYQGPTLFHHDPSATTGARASAEADLGLSINLLMYDAFGPYASLDTDVTLDADLARDPCWTLTGGIDVSAGARIRILDTNIWSKSIPLKKLAQTTLDQGSCPPPPNPPPPIIQGYARSYSDTAWMADGPAGFTNLSLLHDGNHLLTGSGIKTLMKIDKDGGVLWAETFMQDNPATPLLYPVQAVATLDTGVLLASPQDVLVKLDFDGNVDHASHIELPNFAATSDRYTAMARVPFGILVGGAWSPSYSDNADAWLMLLDEKGGVVWSRTYADPEPAWVERVRAIVPLADGALVIGQTEEFSPTVNGIARSFVLRLDAGGQIAWARYLEDCTHTVGLYLEGGTVTEDGQFVFTGFSNFSYPRATLVRMPPDGSGAQAPWATANAVTAILGLRPRSVFQLPTGEFRIAGTRWRATQDDIFVAATDSIGRISWLDVYGGTMQDGAASALYTDDGGILVPSQTVSFTAPNTAAFWLTKVPVGTGSISFSSGSGATLQTETATSSSLSVCFLPAPTTFTDRPTTLASRSVTAHAVTPEVRIQSP